MTEKNEKHKIGPYQSLGYGVGFLIVGILSAVLVDNVYVDIFGSILAFLSVIVIAATIGEIVDRRNDVHQNN